MNNEQHPKKQDTEELKDKVIELEKEIIELRNNFQERANYGIYTQIAIFIILMVLLFS